MAVNQSDGFPVDVYINQENEPRTMLMSKLHGLVEEWKEQGREVDVRAHESESPGYRGGWMKLRVIVDPPPE